MKIFLIEMGKVLKVKEKAILHSLLHMLSSEHYQIKLITTIRSKFLSPGNWHFSGC